MVLHKKTIAGFLLSALILTLSILGARLQNEYYLYAMVVMICATVALVAFGKLDTKSYPYIIFSIGLALLYQTTLLSNYIVGTDNHGEFYHAWLVLTTGKWNYADPFAYNTALGSTLLGPLITTVFKIPLEWVFKAVFPIFLAITPVIAYLIFKRFFGEMVAFFSAIFFMVIPTYIMELPAIGKEQVAELPFALCLYLLLIPKFRLSIRLPLIILLGIITSLAHYTVGIILLIFLIGLVILQLFLKPRLIPVKYLSMATAIIMAVSFVFFSWVASGYTMAKINYIGITMVNMVPGIELDRTDLPSRDTTETPDPMKTPAPEEPSVKPSTLPEKSYFEKHDTMVQAAWGADFPEASVLGKIFRIIQYLTQFLVIAGSIYIFLKRKKLGLSSEYISLFIVGWGLLGLCLFVPGFSTLANVTRFYHFVLYLVAPAFVYGCLLIFRKQIIIPIALIAYFIFTSGAVFELAKVDNIERLDVPYVHSFSAVRIDTTGIFTEAEEEAREWLLNNRDETLPIYGDIHSVYFLTEKLGPTAGLGYIPWYLAEIPSRSYIFLREWNVKHAALTYWTGIGLRKIVPYIEVDWWKYQWCDYLYWRRLMNGRDMIYNRGGVIIYGPK